MDKKNTEDWDIVIKPKHSLLKLNLAEVWRYKDLLLMMIRRDFVTYYKQTILGPIWFFVQPLLTTTTFTLILGKVAKLSTDGKPDFLFYMAGITLWNYFADCLHKTSTTFKDNQNIFGKVYFPRLVVPLSIVISNLLKFGIQYGLFIIVLCVYWFKGENFCVSTFVLITPLLIFLMAILSLGLGMIITSLTTKYRDLYFLIQFSIQLLMYGSSVIIPISMAPDKYVTLLKLNPIVPVIESFKAIYLGGAIDWIGLAYSFVMSSLIFLAGIIIFNKTEKNFMDTI